MRRRDEAPAATATHGPCCTRERYLSMWIHVAEGRSPEELSGEERASLCEHGLARLQAERAQWDAVRAGVGRGGT